jgi:hypothetical protein
VEVLANVFSESGLVTDGTPGTQVEGAVDSEQG